MKFHCIYKVPRHIPHDMRLVCEHLSDKALNYTIPCPCWKPLKLATCAAVINKDSLKQQYPQNNSTTVADILSTSLKAGNTSCQQQEMQQHTSKYFILVTCCKTQATGQRNILGPKMWG